MCDGGDQAAVPGPGVRSAATFIPALLRRDPVDLAVDLRDRYGYVVRIPPVYPALDRPAYLVTHPDSVRRVLQADPNSYRGLEIPGREGFAAAVEGSILGPPGEGGMDWWLERMRQIGPEFSEDAVAGKTPALAGTAARTVATYVDGTGTPGRSRSTDPAAPLDGGRGIRLRPLAARLAARLLGASMFAPDIEDHEETIIRAVARLRGSFKRRRLGTIAGSLVRRLPAPVPAAIDAVEAWRAPDWIDVGRDPLDALRAVAGSMVRRRGRDGPGDAIDAWLTRPDPVSGETMSEAAVVDEVTGMLLAGYATMSAALAWALILLADRPAAQSALHDEARGFDVLGTATGRAGGGGAGKDPPGTATLGYEALLEELPRTHRVWQETLRLYPALPVFGRMTDEAVKLSGYRLPPDVPVLVSPYVTHRDPAFWDDPARFEPARFRPDRSRERPSFAYYPFSAGPHGCLGRYVATVEAVVALATICRHYRIRPLDGDDLTTVGVDSAINLQPARDVRVTLDRRSA